MPFTDEEIRAVWNKGKVTTNNDPNVWRKDQCDAAGPEDESSVAEGVREAFG